MDDAETPEIEVAQKINPAPIIHRLLDALNAAPNRFKAALVIARLHATLYPLRKGDETFTKDWSALLGGRFIQITSSPDAWLSLRWHHVWRAQEILEDLMERHGMGFEAILPNATEQAVADALARGRQLAARTREGRR